MNEPLFASRKSRWLILVLIGAAALLGPLIFAQQIEQIANSAVEAARHSPVLVASLIIAALTLDVFLPVPNGVTNTLAGAIFGLTAGIGVIWTGLMTASLLGYGVGALAAKPLARRLLGDEELNRAHRFAEGLGPLVLILSRPVPVFAELATLAAGMAIQSGGLAIAGGILLPLIAWLGYRWWNARAG